MLNRDFEKAVQKELEDLTVPPSDAVWNKVEASLPEKKKRRWLLLFIPLLLAGSLLIFKNYVGSGDDKGDPTSRTNLNIPEGRGIEKNSSSARPVTKRPSLISDNPEDPEVNNATAEVNTNSEVKVSIRSKTLKHFPNKNISDTKIDKSQKAGTGKSRTSGSALKVNSTAPEAIEEFESVRQAPAVANEKKTFDPVIKNDTSATGLVNETKPYVNTPAIEGLKKDTTIMPLVKKDNQKNKSKWRYGITAGAGIANVKSGLFNKSSISADVFSGSSPLGTPGTQSPLPQQAPSSSFAFTTGLFAERKISSKLHFNTGIIYTYLSNRLKVGTRVDSGGNFITNYGNAYVGSYYRNGNSGKYTNNFHLLSLPVSLHYKPLLQKPVYAEAGLNTSFLLGTNALQYSRSRDAYFEDPESFNRLLLGLQAGIGVELKSLKLGYRFNYSLTSVFKSGSREFPVSSMIYLQLPLKK